MQMSQTVAVQNGLFIRFSF